MSVDIDWTTLTGGPDGAALAETIRAFIHDRFQLATLPRMIRCVNVHSFDFGTVAPSVEIKRVLDPLPDFYHDSDDSDASQDAETGATHAAEPSPQHAEQTAQTPPRLALSTRNLPPTLGISTSATPGILSSATSLGYFHLPLSAGLSGTSTPLAAVAGAQYGTLAPQESGTGMGWTGPRRETTARKAPLPPHMSSSDVQIVARVRYAGDIQLSLTAEILLDYPTPGFIHIPLKLRVTGLTFDGSALLAYTHKSKAHFCFLGPEDVTTLEQGDSAGGGLLEEIRVESEIGTGGNGKQALKNVDRVEKFVLEQVRRIFRDEFVYPNFWTFLV